MLSREIAARRLRCAVLVTVTLGPLLAISTQGVAGGPRSTVATLPARAIAAQGGCSSVRLAVFATYGETAYMLDPKAFSGRSANGCWNFERVTGTQNYSYRQCKPWNITADARAWVYDDTKREELDPNPALRVARNDPYWIDVCAKSSDAGYEFMAPVIASDGHVYWDQVPNDDVKAYFMELYTSAETKTVAGGYAGGSNIVNATVSNDWTARFAGSFVPVLNIGARIDNRSFDGDIARVVGDYCAAAAGTKKVAFYAGVKVPKERMDAVIAGMDWCTTVHQDTNG